MPKRALSSIELREKRARAQAAKFMASVRQFLSNKTGDGVKPEWECSLMLLEEYYKQFVQLTDEINSLESLVVSSRYGSVPHPLLGARDKAAVRLESIMKSVGVTFKEAAKMELIEPVVEESELEKWIKSKNNNIEKR